MGRRLSTGLVLVRSFQVLGSFIPGAMNGWLLYYLHANRLGPSDLMLVLEVLIATIFIHSLCSILITHTGRRSRGTGWMVASVCFDVVFCFVDVAVISLLSFTGLPLNCAGLTISILADGDNADSLPTGSSTTQFSDGLSGHNGALDKFCNMERGFFCCAVLLVLAYISTIIMSVFRICDLNYTRNSQVEDLLAEREGLLKLEYKIQEQEFQPQAHSPAQESAPTFVQSRQDDVEAAATYASMARPTMASSSSSLPIPPSFRYPQVNNLASIPEPAMYQHTHTSGRASPPGPRRPLALTRQDTVSDLDSSEMHANMAMISDGSRYNGSNRIDISQLPPYSPGNQRTMDGHGNENNNTRLSDYIKGATRAQDMKDTGNFH